MEGLVAGGRNGGNRKFFNIAQVGSEPSVLSLFVYFLSTKQSLRPLGYWAPRKFRQLSKAAFYNDKVCAVRLCSSLLEM